MIRRWGTIIQCTLCSHVDLLAGKEGGVHGGGLSGPMFYLNWVRQEDGCPTLPHLPGEITVTVLPLPYVSITALSRPNGPGAQTSIYGILQRNTLDIANHVCSAYLARYR